MESLTSQVGLNLLINALKGYNLMNVAVRKNQKPKGNTMKYLQLFSVLLIIVFASCKKGDNYDNIAPTDLVVKCGCQ